jgi:hypothetical protein
MNMLADLSPNERASVWWTIAMTAVALAIAIVGERYDSLWALAGAVGGLGGLAHEFAQSGGKVRFFKKCEDGYYMGSVSGMFLGAIAGLLVVRGLFEVSSTEGVGSAGSALSDRGHVIQIWYEAFFAGLGLKGVTEALGGKAVPDSSTAPLTHDDVKETLQLLDSIEPSTPPQP